MGNVTVMCGGNFHGGVTYEGPKHTLFCVSHFYDPPLL